MERRWSWPQMAIFTLKRHMAALEAGRALVHACTYVQLTEA